MRSDAEWQSEVYGLMNSAQLLLASVGNSRWIKWELAEIINRGFERKALFFFPVTIRRGRWWLSWGVRRKQRAQQLERITAIVEAYPSNRSPDYTVLSKNEFLLAQVTAGPQTYLLTTLKPGSNSQVLAIIVGHYLLGHSEQSIASAPGSVAAIASR